MTKNERSLQWVIAGIFFVVCFAFFQWIYPNHLFFKEQMRIFLYTTDYFISFWDEPAWLSCYVGNFLIQFFHLTVIGPLIVTCVLCSYGTTLCGFYASSGMAIWSPYMRCFR